MTRSITTKLATLFTLAITALFASQAKADIYDNIDRSARKIQRKTKALLTETIHYRHTPQYVKIVKCTNELNRLATHIHEVSHFEGNLVHLREDLRLLDAEFHLLEGLYDAVEEAAACGRVRIEGNTRYVKVLLNSIDDCICEIRDHVESLVAACPLSRPVVAPTIITQPIITRTTRTVVTEPVLVPTRPVIAGGFDDRGRDDYRHGYSRGHSYSRGRGYGGYHAKGGQDRYAGRGGRNSGFGFSIGGGSSKIVFGF